MDVSSPSTPTPSRRRSASESRPHGADSAAVAAAPGVFDRAFRVLRARPLADVGRWCGTLGAVLIAVGSWGAGAVRFEGGILRSLGLANLMYGHAAALLNACFWTGLTLLVLGWICVGRAVVFLPSGELQRPFADAAATLRRCLWWWTIPLVCAAPVLSRDVYSYLMQGALTRDGFDAYKVGAVLDPGPYLAEVSHDWRTTTTPYGPLHLWLGKVVTSLSGDSVTLGIVAYKVLAVAGFVLIAITTARIAQALGGNPALALWLGVTNPITLTHIVGGMHNEALMVGLSGVAVLLAVRSRVFTATAVLAVAVAVKATAIIILPFFAWIAAEQFLQWRQTRNHRTVPGSPRVVAQHPWWVRCVTAIGAGIVLAVELLVVLGALTKAVGSSWGWVAEISGNGKVINPLAAPSFIAGVIVPFGRQFNEDFSYNTTLGIARTAASVLMLVGLAACWFYFSTSRRKAVSGMVAAFGVASVFNSVALPWYYISPLALVGAVRPPKGVIRLVVAATIVVGMSFTASGNHKLYDTVWIVPLIVAAWICAGWLVGVPLPWKRTPQQAPASAA